LISTTGVLGGLLLFAPFGLFWTAIGLLTSSGLSLILTYWVSSRYGDVNWAQIGRECWPAFVASALMAAGVLAMKHTVLSGADSLLSLALQVVVGSVVFSAAIRVLAPHRFDIALEFVSKASSHGRK
jgi:peptidoglycan biosynthesis protein MviN/MurJ (putative lipid II flippase)